ncbi:carbonic anhydrase 2-like [Anthonomus grandis grandis]|uniref:carbonic anhydrase 2-like n=1 Tax=Anthonomus grandis grandis TaxID=2921223 RepID=UPI0021652661|nr:carbonic anhydrase 2-like [Anthonomus grandis grandis]
MDELSSYLPDQVSLYYYIILAACVLAALYINDMISKMDNYRGFDKKQLINYGYEIHNGPSLWKNFFTEAGGCKQSPINLINRCAMCVPSELNPLKFSDEFEQLPCEIKIYNSGLNAVLYAKWSGFKRPSLSGGPLECDTFTFLNLRFRWGPTDDEGSEHMIETKRFALEMQVAFTKDANNTKCDLFESARCGNLLMLTYIFMVTPTDNPYLEPIIQALNHLKCPLSCVMICPFPLKLLTPSFANNYFFYEGSLTFPPCTEGVKWIVQPEPLLISSRQVKKFRKLGACNMCAITCNSRPVQSHNGREVLFYD